MYKRIKDDSKIVAQWKLKVKGKHYYHVFLWKDQEAFDKNTCDNPPGEISGCVNYAPTYLNIYKGKEIHTVLPKLGEIHFIQGIWTLEIVAHELLHAMLHRINVLRNPLINDIFDQNGTAEEDICYDFGRWADEIYRRLWEVTPQKRKKDAKKRSRKST